MRPMRVLSDVPVSRNYTKSENDDIPEERKKLRLASFII